MGAPGEWCCRPSSALCHPLRFNNRKTDSCPAGFHAGPCTHVASFSLHTAPVKRMFLIPILQRRTRSLRRVSDWFEMPLLLRGRVGIWAPNGHTQWWNLVQVSHWEEPGRTPLRAEGRAGGGRWLLRCWWSRLVMVFVCTMWSQRSLELPLTFPSLAAPWVTLLRGPEAVGGFVVSRE